MAKHRRTKHFDRTKLPALLAVIILAAVILYFSIHENVVGQAYMDYWGECDESQQDEIFFRDGATAICIQSGGEWVIIECDDETGWCPTSEMATGTGGWGGSGTAEG